MKDQVKAIGTVEYKLVGSNGKTKKLFKGNFLWKAIKSLLNKDIVINHITGFYTDNVKIRNLVVTKGKELVAKQLNGVTTAPVTAIAIGIGTTAPAAGNTALETEISTNGGQRGAATCSAVTTTTTNDTAQWSKTFTFTGSFAVTEEGLLDNNTAGGNLLARVTFSAVNVVNGDSLTMTHKLQLT